MGSEICVPLLKDRTALGTLNVESPSHRPLTEKDVQLLTSFADQVTVAVENARLYELEQRRRQEVAAIAEVGCDISASLRLDIVLERIAMYARNLLRAETSAVYIYDPTQSILIANSAIGPDADEIKRDPVRIGEGILGNIFLQKTGEIVNETSGDPRAITIQGTEDVVDEHLIGAPILSRDQLTGLIAVWRIGTGEEFESTDLDFLNDLALQAAIAIENARLYAKAQHTAILDELTGAYNRRGLFEIGKQEFDRSVRFKRSLVALFLDIDHFKKFNDTFSYAVGDLVLRMFTDCLRSNLREFDLIGRYGGEEFVVLLPEAEIEAAREVAERIRKSVAALKVQTDRGETGITVSIGVCARTLQMPGLEALIDQAGQITHLAKHDGRNRVVVGQ